MALVLRLRLSPTMSEAAKGTTPLFHETLQQHMNSNVCWLFRQLDPWFDRHDRQWRFLTEHQMLASDSWKFYLEKPAEPGAQWDYDIVFLRKLKKYDRAAAIAGQEVADGIEVLVPGAGIPTPVSAPADIIFVVKARSYTQLASHLKMPINLALHKVKVGRTWKRVFWSDDAIFYLQADPGVSKVSTAEDAAKLHEALVDAEVGRVLTDSYELRRARDLVSKYGEVPPRVN